MKITNWKHLPWFLFVCLATIAASLLYVANFHPDSLPAGIRLPSSLIQTPTEHHTVGGTPLGLVFGTISLGIFVFAALLSLRKKIPLWRVGTVQRWLRAHIWLTFLTVPLVLFHSGFRFGGQMTTLLMVLYAIVMVSGVYGLFLQHRMPQLMKDQLPRETVFAEIPVIRAQLVAAAAKMRDSLKSATPVRSDTRPAHPVTKVGTVGAVVPISVSASANAMETATMPAPAAVATAVGSPRPPTAEAIPTPTAQEREPQVIASAPRATVQEPAVDPASEAALLEFIERDILPYLQAKRAVRMRLNNHRFSDDTFRFMKLRVGQAYRRRVEEIQSWCDERRLLDRQVRLQHWLHGWLFVHVPFSFLLLLLTFWHAYVTLFYY
jgi:hypothetical protein